MAAVRPVESKAVTDRFGARENLLLEILRSETAARLEQIQQHAGPQRGVGDDEVAGGGFRQQRPIDEQRRNERLGLDRGQSEAGHEAVVVQPLDLLAEARNASRGISRIPSPS